MNPMKCSEVLKLTSQQLIDLLASLGYGAPHSPSDKRDASVHETGFFTTRTGKHKGYAKVVVVCKGSDTVEDYGVRLLVSEVGGDDSEGWDA